MRIDATVENGAGFVWHCWWDDQDPPTVVFGGKMDNEGLTIRSVGDPMVDEDANSFLQTMLHDLTYIQSDSAWVYDVTVNGIDVSQEWVDSEVNNSNS